jgi:hypothetical protein
MTAGRPPKPAEVKRRLGNPGKRQLSETVIVLPMAAGVPDPPEDLGLAGRHLWSKAWAGAVTWLSPDSDAVALESACRLADDLQIARKRYRVTSDPKDARVVVAFAEQRARSLARLGFDPTARSQLGVAEVKKLSKLDELRVRHAR